MHPIELDPPLSLRQALLLDHDEREHLGADDLVLTATEREQACSLWLHLRGIADPLSPEGVLAYDEVAGDSPLICALHLPADEFLHWFRVQDWEGFDASEATGGIAWAWDVLDRARAGVASLGRLAAQQPLIEVRA